MSNISSDTNKPKNEQWKNSLIIAVGASFAEMLADTIIYPFDTMNTWIKAERTNIKQTKLV
jgi:hypothetical protein